MSERQRVRGSSCGGAVVGLVEPAASLLPPMEAITKTHCAYQLGKRDAISDQATIALSNRAIIESVMPRRRGKSYRLHNTCALYVLNQNSFVSHTLALTQVTLCNISAGSSAKHCFSPLVK